MVDSFQMVPLNTFPEYIFYILIPVSPRYILKDHIHNNWGLIQIIDKPRADETTSPELKHA